MHIARAAAALVVASALVSPSFAAVPLGLQPVVTTGLSTPLYLTAAPGDNNRLFILEKGGAVRLFNRTTNTLQVTPYLTVPASTSGERGLLGMAFAPDFASSGVYYLSYTRTDGDLVVVRGTATGTPLSSTGGTAVTSTPLITVEHSTNDNHNGGWIGFSPNNANNLYISTGDGGSGNDPPNNAQNNAVLNGKMLRIAVTSTGGYTIPAGNPFAAAGDGILDEIWAKGLRNAWRPSFDRTTGDFYIADVGQGAREEVNFQPAASTGGQNYGWRAYEGTIETPGLESDPNPSGATFPIHEYTHSVGQSITGGYVYRGTAIAGLQGTYFFGDYTTGKLFSFAYPGTGTIAATNRTAEMDPTGLLGSFSITSFGEDAAGELYVVDGAGQVYRIVPEPAALALVLCGGLSLARVRRGSR
jgi:glucose/arabinose dehydrogenase